MNLPNVDGWIIDFRTARAFLCDEKNACHIDHCRGACSVGQMHICHCEQSAFDSVPILKNTFVDCVIVPDEIIMSKCVAVAAAKPQGKRQIVGNQCAVFMVAIASSRRLGIISDHRAPMFATVYEMGLHYGIPSFRSSEFFERFYVNGR